MNTQPTTRPLALYSDSQLLFAVLMHKTSLLTNTHPTPDSKYTETVEVAVTREQLLDELGCRPWVDLTERRKEVRCRLYRSTFIYTKPGATILGATIYTLGEDGQQYDHADEAQAEEFIDASLEISGLLIGALA